MQGLHWLCFIIDYILKKFSLSYDRQGILGQGSHGIYSQKTTDHIALLVHVICCGEPQVPCNTTRTPAEATLCKKALVSTLVGIHARPLNVLCVTHGSKNIEPRFGCMHAKKKTLVPSTGCNSVHNNFIARGQVSADGMIGFPWHAVEKCRAVIARQRGRGLECPVDSLCNCDRMFVEATAAIWQRHP